MFPAAAVALITLLLRLGDTFVSEIVRPMRNEICNRLFLARVIHVKKKKRIAAVYFSQTIYENHRQFLYFYFFHILHAICSQKGKSNRRHFTIIAVNNFLMDLELILL